MNSSQNWYIIRQRRASYPGPNNAFLVIFSVGPIALLIQVPFNQLLVNSLHYLPWVEPSFHFSLCDNRWVNNNRIQFRASSERIIQRWVLFRILLMLRVLNINFLVQIHKILHLLLIWKCIVIDALQPWWWFPIWLLISQIELVHNLILFIPNLPWWLILDDHRRLLKMLLTLYLLIRSDPKINLLIRLVSVLYSIIKRYLLLDKIHLHFFQVIQLFNLLLQNVSFIIILDFDLQQLLILTSTRGFLPHHLELVVLK